MQKKYQDAQAKFEQNPCVETRKVLSLNDKCTFCNSSIEELHHLFFECSHVQDFWKTFSSWWFELVNENISMTLKDIILGLLNRTDIINYLIILGKLCIWECRKAGIYPDFNIFLKKFKNKFETEKYIANNQSGLRASSFMLWTNSIVKLNAGNSNQRGKKRLLETGGVS